MKKYKSILLIFAISLLAVACSQSKQFKPEQDMKKIVVLEPDMEVKVGQKVYYTANTHGSVGVEVKAWSENETIIKLIDTHFAYNDEKSAKMSGGDSGKRTYIFEALQTGKTTVIIEDAYRGEVKNTYNIAINVIE